jgi:hypothetical protein
MSDTIRTYKDLVVEEKRLEELLNAQKVVLQYDMKLLKEQLNPAIRTFGMLGTLFTKDRAGGLLNVGADTIIDLVVRNGILGKAGWLTKFIVPFFLKNASSHIIADKKNSWLKKALSLFKKTSHNGQTSHTPEESEK